MKEKITVLGAGITGLTLAWRIRNKSDFDINVIEKSKNIGGVCGTFKHKDCRLDYGPHKFYSQIKGIMPLYKDILGEECLTIKKANSLRLLGKYFSFPPKSFQLMFGVGLFKIMKIGSSFGVTTLKSPFSGKVKNYEDYFIKGFGKQAYNLIFKDLANKMWGDPRTLSAELGRRRVPVPNIFSLVLNTITGAKNKPDVSAEYFYYPKKGFGFFCEKIQEKIKEDVLLDSLPVKITTKDDKISSVTYKKNNKNSTIKTDYLVSTIPLLELVELFSPKAPEEVINAAKGLKYRDLMIFYIFSDKGRIIKDNWYFYPDKEVIFNRVSEVNSFSPHMCEGKSCITVEVTLDEDSKKDDKEIFEDVVRDLEKANVIKREEIKDHIVKKIKKVYPVYDLDFRRNLNIILDYLAKFENFLTIGRHGLFNYNNADHCMDMAIKTADHIIGKKSKEEWKKLLDYFDKYRIVD